MSSIVVSVDCMFFGGFGKALASLMDREIAEMLALIRRVLYFWIYSFIGMMFPFGEKTAVLFIFSSVSEFR